MHIYLSERGGYPKGLTELPWTDDGTGPLARRHRVVVVVVVLFPRRPPPPSCGGIASAGPGEKSVGG